MKTNTKLENYADHMEMSLLYIYHTAMLFLNVLVWMMLSCYATNLYYVHYFE